MKPNGLCRRMTWWTRPAATRPEHAYGAVSRRSCRWRPPPEYGARACRARLLCRACRARLRPSRVMRRSARLARYGPRLASGRPPQSSPCGSGDSDGPGPRPAGSVIAAMPPVSARAQPQPRTVPPRRVPCSGRRRSAPRGPRPLVSSKGANMDPVSPRWTQVTMEKWSSSQRSTIVCSSQRTHPRRRPRQA